MDPSVESRLATLEVQHEIHKEHQRDHESRIRHLERWVWTAIGTLTLVELLPQLLDFVKRGIVPQ